MISSHLRLNFDPKDKLQLIGSSGEASDDEESFPACLSKIEFDPDSQKKLISLMDMQNKSFDSIRSREMKSDLANFKRTAQAWYKWENAVSKL